MSECKHYDGLGYKGECVYCLKATIEEQTERIAELEAENKVLEIKTTDYRQSMEYWEQEYRRCKESEKALREAVKALPVEPMIKRDFSGDAELIGYCMQCQGEWSRVLELLEASIPDSSKK